MSNAQDLYAVLGVPPHGSSEDIRSAYRALARRLHPDVNQNPGAANQFRDIAAAYSILEEPIERQKYDNARKREGVGGNYFTLRVTPSQRILPVLTEPQVLYLLVELLPERSRNVQQMETHLNLTLVLDQSTSMKGPRLERVKVAAHQIIDQLGEKDIFSVVTFSDHSEVLLKAAPMTDKPNAKSRITMMQAFGGTEIHQGLSKGIAENERFLSKQYVNHIILLTDGRTFMDERQTLELADKAAKEGIGISAMGMGDEWNDTFLDQLAGRTGGTSEYINSPMAVVRFLNDRVRTLGQSYAERVMISVAPDADIKLESAFRLMPSAQPVNVETDPIQLGALQVGGTASILFQLQIAPLTTPGFRSLLRVDVTGDILREQKFGYKVIADTSVEVSNEATMEEPPLAIMDALSKLTLYRIQEKAEQAMARGDIREATRHLENLATRLLSSGQPELAEAAIAEAKRVSNTNVLSSEGQKALKYGTRLLIETTGSTNEDQATPA